MSCRSNLQLFVCSSVRYVENGSIDSFEMEPDLFVVVQYDLPLDAAHVKFDLICC